MILEVFSNLNDSVIVFYGSKQPSWLYLHHPHFRACHRASVLQDSELWYLQMSSDFNQQNHLPVIIKT